MKSQLTQFLKSGRKVVVAVEGKDLKALLINLIGGGQPGSPNKPGFEEIIVDDFTDIVSSQITATESLDRWLTQITKAMQDIAPTVRCLAIIRDAEFDREATIRSAREAFAKFLYPLPITENEWTSEEVKTAFLMLGNSETGQGCLEHVMLESLGEDWSSLKTCADAFVACSENLYLQRHPDAKTLNWRAKVATRAIIAGSDKPGTQFGTSVKLPGLWSQDKPALKRVLDFLREANRKAYEPPRHTTE